MYVAGMSDKHSCVERFSLSEHERVQRQIHRRILLEHHRQGKITLPLSQLLSQQGSSAGSGNHSTLHQGQGVAAVNQPQRTASQGQGVQNNLPTGLLTSLNSSCINNMATVSNIHENICSLRDVDYHPAVDHQSPQSGGSSSSLSCYVSLSRLQVPQSITDCPLENGVTGMISIYGGLPAAGSEDGGMSNGVCLNRSSLEGLLHTIAGEPTTVECTSIRGPADLDMSMEVDHVNDCNHHNGGDDGNFNGGLATSSIGCCVDLGTASIEYCGDMHATASIECCEDMDTAIVGCCGNLVTASIGCRGVDRIIDTCRVLSCQVG